MNAEFMEKMLRAKRLEAQAFASLVPDEAKAPVAAAVRICATAALDVLEPAGARRGRAPKVPGDAVPGSDNRHEGSRRSDVRPIPID